MTAREEHLIGELAREMPAMRTRDLAVALVLLPLVLVWLAVVLALGVLRVTAGSFIRLFKANNL